MATRMRPVERERATLNDPRPVLRVEHETAAVGDSPPREGTSPTSAGPANGVDAGPVDALLTALLGLVGRRLSEVSARDPVAVLLHYVLRAAPGPDSSVRVARRPVAQATDVSVWAVRRALDQLLQWGWLEPRQAARNTAAHYRLTPVFLETVKAADAALYHALRDRLSGSLMGEDTAPGRGAAPGETACSALPPTVRHASPRDLRHRLLALNEQRRHYGEVYRMGMLRTAAAVLHRLIQEDAGTSVDPSTVSLRALARDTGLTFRSVQRARARLVAWGLLREHAGVWRLERDRLLSLLYDADAELPAPARAKRESRTTFME